MKKYTNTNKALRQIVLAGMLAAPVWVCSAATLDTTASNLTAPSVVTVGTATTTTDTNGNKTWSQSITVGGSATSNTILYWGNFNNLGVTANQADILNFVLPTADSAVLNKVTAATTIGDGAADATSSATISSNGKVFFYSPAGMIINNDVTINTAGFAASSITADSVEEMENNFVSTGTLSYETSGAGAALTSAGIINVGASGNIVLAGTSINVTGTLTGNTVVNAEHATAASGTAAVATTKVTGNLDINSTGAVTVGAAATEVTGNLTVDTDAAVTLSSVATTKVGGNLTVGAGGAVQLSGAAVTTVSGNVSVDVTDLAVSSTTGLVAKTAGKSVTITSGTGNITLAGAGDVETLNVTSTGTVDVTDATAITINSAATTALAIDATSSGNKAITITSGGAVNIIDLVTTEAASVTAAGNITNTTLANATGNLTLKSTAGKVTVTGAAGTSGKDLTIEAYNDVELAAAAYTVGNKTLTLKSTNGTVKDLAGTTVGALGGSVVISSKGDLTLLGTAGITAKNVTLTSTGGFVKAQAGIITTTGGVATFNAASAITVDTVNHDFDKLVISNAGSTSAISIKDVDGLDLGATSLVGDLTLALGGALNLGSAATDVLSLGKVTVTGATTVTGVSKTITTGALILTASGNVSLAGVTDQAYTFGDLTLTVGGSLAIDEAAAMTFGGNSSVATTADLTSSVSIKTAKVLSTGGLTTLNAPEISLTGANLLGDLKIGNLGTTDTVSIKEASDVTVLAADSIKATTSVSLTADVAGDDITIAGGIETGTLTLSTKTGGAGTITATAGINKIDTLVLAAAGTGAIAVDDDAGNLTVSGSSAGATTITAVGAIDYSAETNGNLAITSNTSTVNYTGDTTGTVGLTGKTGVTFAGTSDSGAVTLAASGKGNVVFSGSVDTGSVTVTNVEGTITLSGTVDTGNLTSTNTKGATTFTGTVEGGSVSLTATDGAVTTNGTVDTGNTVVTSTKGDVTVGGNSLSGNFTVTASNGNVVLNNYYNDAGTLSITATTSGKTITDATGARVNVFGATSFVTAKGAITIDNFSDISTSPTVGHRFGGLTIDTTNAGAQTDGADVKISEGGTLRIVSLDSGTKGNVTLSATSTDAEVGTALASNIVGTAAGTTINVGGNLILNAKDTITIAPNANTLTFTVGGNLYALANFNAGAVTLGTAATATNAIDVAGLVNVVSGKDATIFSNVTAVAGDNLQLGATEGVGTGDFYVGGVLKANSSGKITEIAGTKLYTSASTTYANDNASVFTAAGAIDLSTGTNVFGKVSLVAAGQAVKISEAGTLNLSNVNVGAFTATATGDIIDTKVAGTDKIVAAATTLSAANITLDTAANDLTGTVKVTATGDVKLVDVNGISTDTSTVTGNLTLNTGGNSTVKKFTVGGNVAVTNTAGTMAFSENNVTGSTTVTNSAGTLTLSKLTLASSGAFKGAGITAADKLDIAGNASFDGGTGAISLTNVDNAFGLLTFKTTNNVTIVENGTMELGSGNSVGGNTDLKSQTGDISSDATSIAASAFTGDVRLEAITGKVTILRPWSVGGQLRIWTPAGQNIDLHGISAVSLANTPILLSGSYVTGGEPQQ